MGPRETVRFIDSIAHLPYVHKYEK